jgi:hypothetical protein
MRYLFLFLFIPLTCVAIPGNGPYPISGGGASTNLQGLAQINYVGTNVIQIPDYYHLYVTGTTDALVGTTASPSLYTRMLPGYNDGYATANPAYTNNNGRMLWLDINPNDFFQTGGKGWILTSNVFNTNGANLYYDFLTGGNNPNNQPIQWSTAFTSFFVYPITNQWATGMYGAAGSGTNSFGTINGGTFPFVLFATNTITNIVTYLSTVPTNNTITIDPINGNDSTGYKGGYAFKTIQAAMQFSTGGERWHFLYGTNYFIQYVWNPNNANVDMDSGASIEQLDIGFGVAISPVGAFSLNGGTIQQPMSYGFGGPVFLYQAQTSNLLAFNNVHIIAEHGGIQPESSAATASFIEIVKNCVLDVGSYGIEVSGANIIADIVGNIVNEHSWLTATNEQEVGSILNIVGLYSAGTTNYFASGNIVNLYDSYADAGGGKCIWASTGGGIVASGNELNTALGTNGVNWAAYANGTGYILLQSGNYPSSQVSTNVYIVPVYWPTNYTVGGPNMTLQYSEVVTNAAFTYGAPFNLTANGYNQHVDYVTNSSGSVKTITPPAGHSEGTWNVTNESAITTTIWANQWTNFICTPIW